MASGSGGALVDDHASELVARIPLLLKVASQVQLQRECQLVASLHFVPGLQNQVRLVTSDTQDTTGSIQNRI